ncbi:MAG TPA: hypothetical protein VJU87_12830 [Gemmatimonadaceae bacterium]|nr:hypothetical protein [Gemmatimonadaceae bacterium]
MLRAARIAIIGDRDPAIYTHRAVDDALRHACETREHAVDAHWIATSDVAVDPIALLASLDGIWLAPGSPYASMDGALAAVRIARERQIPFLGVCGGFQHAIIEVARAVAGITGADHAESNPGATTPVIAALECSMLEKSGPVFLDPTCRTAAIYARWRIVERYHCSYGLNAGYRETLERVGLHFVGEDDQGDARVAELLGHPFFIATLFQPQLGSAPGSPAPLVRAFVDAAIHHRDRQQTPVGIDSAQVRL